MITLIENSFKSLKWMFTNLEFYQNALKWSIFMIVDGVMYSTIISTIIYSYQKEFSFLLFIGWVICHALYSGLGISIIQFTFLWREKYCSEKVPPPTTR